MNTINKENKESKNTKSTATESMSIALINQYYNEKLKIRNISKQDSESVMRRAFARLLEGYAHKKHLTLIEEFTHKTEIGSNIRFDGVVKNDMGLNFGFWEAKANVDLEDEIRKKFNKGYPKSNILFEDGKQAVLYQNAARVKAVDITDSKELHALLEQFMAFETPELRSFHEAVANFKKDVPEIASVLRGMIEQQDASNPTFQKARNHFLELCRDAINPDIDKADVDEMLIQHILTEQIFMSVFSDAQFIKENNIARELYKVEETFFTGNVKRSTLDKIKNYYDVIALSAKSLNDHTEKQFFLKRVYENFYKAYNPKGADKLGIVYTPSEIVQFQIKSTEFLLEKHFGKTLSDRGVEILDPATGTGTYICDLIEHINPHELAYKYKNDIHANEVAILPYYIANLNIEYTFRHKMGYYEEFPNICFVDTLDNIGGLSWKGKQFDMFGFSAENAERIKKQNESKISVIIGNPPYNAKQANFNDDNKNKLYKDIDKRIKETFIKQGTAQNQIVVYDMYVRFFRWAFDRLNKDGIVTFITNRSFIDGQAFDGFRKCVQAEFNEIYIVDTNSDVRKNPKIAGTTHNVFGIQTGVAIMFLVKKEQKQDFFRIYYAALEDEMIKADNLNWFRETPLSKMPFQRITPDAKGNWINQTDNDFDTLLPLINKEAKAGKKADAIFNFFLNGFETGRDEWNLDFDKANLTNKIQFFINKFNESIDKNEEDKIIKWNRHLSQFFEKRKKLTFNRALVSQSYFRPFVKKYHFTDGHLNYLLGRTHAEVFGIDYKKDNKVIVFSGSGFNQPFHSIATTILSERHLVEKSQCLPLSIYAKNGDRQENITDWALQQFQTHYGDVEISKTDIFYYVYAVLHTPQYRTKYEQNLKRDFPRIPFYLDFKFFSERGKALANLHIGYETGAYYPLELVERPTGKDKQKAVKPALFDVKTVETLTFQDAYVPKPKLKADKENGTIELDDVTTLTGIPAEAWHYKLGNRSALEWILDQYKESKPTDKTIEKQFNTYRFSDYKTTVIDLLKRVCQVSVETVRLVDELADKLKNQGIL